MWWVLLVPALITAVLYFPALEYGFLLDDHVLFETSASLQQPNSIRLGFARDVGALRKGSDTVLSSYYRPVFLALSTLYHQQVGADPRAWHLAAVVLAAAVAVLAAAFLLRMGIAPVVACLAATAYTLHPSHVSSIAWVSGLQELLAAAFVLLALLAALRRGSGSSDRVAIALAAASFLVALLSKEVAIGLLPFVAAWAWLERRGEQGTRLRRTAWAFALVTAAYLLVRIAVLGGLTHSVPGTPDFLTALPALPAAFVTYLRLLVWPTDFSFFRPERPDLAAFSAPALTGLAALAGAITVTVIAVRRRSSLALPCFWFAAFLLPVLNLWALPPQWMITDRYLFLPSLALPWLIATLPVRRVVVAGVLVAMSLGFAILTLRYRPIFRDEHQFLAAMEIAEPSSALVQSQKAWLLRREGNLQGSRTALERAVALDPASAAELISLGDLELAEGKLESAEGRYRAALAQEPWASRGFKLLVVAHSRAGHADRALALSREAAARWQDDFEVQLMHAVVLAGAQDRVGAELAFDQARRLRPEDPAVQDGLDTALQRLAPRLRP